MWPCSWASSSSSNTQVPSLCCRRVATWSSASKRKMRNPPEPPNGKYSKMWSRRTSPTSSFSRRPWAKSSRTYSLQRNTLGASYYCKNLAHTQTNWLACNFSFASNKLHLSAVCGFHTQIFPCSFSNYATAHGPTSLRLQTHSSAPFQLGFCRLSVVRVPLAEQPRVLAPPSAPPSTPTHRQQLQWLSDEKHASFAGEMHLR